MPCSFQAARARGIGGQAERVIVLRTPEAVERYNALAATEPVGALIHSTC